MKKIIKNLSIFKMLCGIFVVGVMIGPRLSMAQCATCNDYENALRKEITNHQNWMNNTWWVKNFEPALQNMSNEISNATTFAVSVFGSFLDGQNLMYAMRTMQDLNATTLKNYAPSDSLCKFGTLSKSLAQSYSKSKANQLILSKRSRNRQLGQTRMASAEGEQSDRLKRWSQFMTTYCDPEDFNNGLREVCAGNPPDTRRNADINFTRTVDTHNTINMDMTDGAVSSDEQDVLALANNLYAHRVFNRINADSLQTDSATDLQTVYMDQRSVVAKRSVAENSFNALVSQKASGAAASKTYLIAVLKSLGLSDADAAKYIGDAPSYDAQMEVLTKKLYQDPAFYVNLMESTANVNRQYAALQSFGLMQKRDIFESVTRTEMLLSLLLEMEVAKYQDILQGQ